MKQSLVRLIHSSFMYMFVLITFNLDFERAVELDGSKFTSKKKSWKLLEDKSLKELVIDHLSAVRNGGQCQVTETSSV